jgi:hypothetical protein
MNTWINVKDKLPEVKKDVLMLNEDGCRVGYIREDGSWINYSDSCGCCDYFNENVTHWMELPGRPK